MGALGEFNNALLQFGNTVSNVNRDYAERQAKLDLTTMSINLEKEINNKMLQLQQSNNYQDWEKEIDNFYQERIAAMSDQNSPYYCRNNFTANAAQQMLEQSRNAYQNKAANMALQKLNEQDVVKVNNAKTDLSNLYTGQEYINRANELDVQLYDKGILSPEQYDSRIKNNYIEGRYNYYAQKLDDNMDAAIKEGKSFEKLWSENVENDKEQLKLYDKGIEIAVDNKVIDGKLKQAKQQQFNARVAEMQTQNAQYFVSDVSDINSDIINLLSGRGNKTVNDIITHINIGANKVDTMGGNQLAPGKQREISNWYKNLLGDISEYEKAVKSGNTGSATLTAFESYIKNMPETALQKVADGTLSDRYTAVEAMKNIYRDDFFNNDWKETKGMTTAQKQDYWNKHYSELPVMQILDSKELKTALQNEPQFADLNQKYNNFLADIKKHPEDYTIGAGEYIMSFVYDAVAASGKNTDMKLIAEGMDKNLNAVTVSKLDKLFRGQKLLEGEEKYLARTANELINNDIVHTDTNGREVWAPGAKEKVDAIAKEQKSYIENALDIELDAPIYRRVRNDVEPIPEFKDNKGNTYHIEADANGKNPLIINQNGEVINPINKTSLQEQDEKEKEKSKEAMQQAHEANQEYQLNRNAERNAAISAGNTIPDKIKIAGSVTEAEWSNSEGDVTTRQILIQDSISAVNDMAKAVRKGKMTEEEFKEKIGITKDEWDKMKYQQRENYLMN